MRQMLDDAKTQAVVNQLFNCFDSSCCATAGVVAAATKCNLAYSHTGETITSLTGISSLG
jgi:hypothetical protein